MARRVTRVTVAPLCVYNLLLLLLLLPAALSLLSAVPRVVVLATLCCGVFSLNFGKCFDLFEGEELSKSGPDEAGFDDDDPGGGGLFRGESFWGVDELVLWSTRESASNEPEIGRRSTDSSVAWWSAHSGRSMSRVALDCGLWWWSLSKSFLSR